MRGVVMRITLFSAFMLSAWAAGAEPALLARPDLCVTTLAQPACEVEITVSWRAEEVAEHCVHAAPAAESPRITRESARRCWPASVAGEMTDPQTIDASFDYLLTKLPGRRLEERPADSHNDQETARVLLRTPVRVLPARSSDRRRNRRRRHVWSVL